jgi:hypothetical protein
MTQKDKYYHLLDQYVKGQLSQQDRHDLEKKALDDPFFFDALEGWAKAGNADHSIHISSLKNKINRKSQSSLNRKIIWPVAIAASLILLFSIGNILTKDEKQSLATVTPEEVDEIAVTDISSDPKNTQEAPYNDIPTLEEETSLITNSETKDLTSSSVKEESVTEDDDRATGSSALVLQDKRSPQEDAPDKPAIPVNPDRSVIGEEAGTDIASASEDIVKPSPPIDADELRRQPLSGIKGLKTRKSTQNAMAAVGVIEIIDKDLDDFVRKNLFMKGLNPIAKRVNAFDITFDENLMVTDVKLVSEKSELSDSIIEIITNYKSWKKNTIPPNLFGRYNYPSRQN